MNVRDELKNFKKERILEEAQRLFYERGYRGTSLDAIAESLNVTKPFLYAVYDRKVDILVDISLRALTRVIDALAEARAAGGTPAAQMNLFARRFTEMVIRNQASSAVFFREEASIPPEVTRQINDLKGQFDEQLAALIQDGVNAGEFRVRDVRTASLAVGGMISWMYIWYRPGGRLTPEQIGDHMTEYVMNLLGTRPLAV